MKQVIIFAAAFLGAAGVGVVILAQRGQAGSDGAGEEISAREWEKGAASEAGVVLVDFSAEWCGPCRRMKPVLKSLASDFKVVMVDVDKSRALAARYNIRSIPALMIFKNGRVVKRFSGVTSESTLRKALREAGAG
jgi:thioredoxin 1